MAAVPHASLSRLRSSTLDLYLLCPAVVCILPTPLHYSGLSSGHYLPTACSSSLSSGHFLDDFLSGRVAIYCGHHCCPSLCSKHHFPTTLSSSYSLLVRLHSVLSSRFDYRPPGCCFGRRSAARRCSIAASRSMGLGYLSSAPGIYLINFYGGPRL